MEISFASSLRGIQATEGSSYRGSTVSYFSLPLLRAYLDRY